MISKKSIMLLALGTLIIFGGLGLAFIPFVRETDSFIYLSGIKPLWLQLLAGLTLGIVTAKAGWQIVLMPRLRKTKIFFTSIIKPLDLTILEIILISACAGIGEELFFRGVVQPLLGVWATSVLFVLLHGYLNPFNLPLTLYGLYMVLVIGVIGLFAEYLGILSSIIAHSVIDFILLTELSKAELPENDSESE
jgi:hypothetical protein